MMPAGDAHPEQQALRIDLNADLGEGIGDDEALLEIVTSANIATGAHAGGGAMLARAVAAAARRGVAIGAHPSYRDPAGFGRASHLAVLHADVSARAHLVGDLVAQILLVAHEAERHAATLTHVKAHGSLYNEAVHDAVAAHVVVDAVLGAELALGYPVAVMTQPGGELAGIAGRGGLTVIREGFADRGYLSTGQLVPRGEPGAVHSDTRSMVAQALDLAGGHVDPADGPRIPVGVDSLCVHGDTPGAVTAARAIREALQGRGWQVVAPRGSAGGIDAVAIRAFGDRALLVEPAAAPSAVTPWVLRVAARARRRWPRATIVPGLANVLVAFDRPSDRPEPRDVHEALSLAAQGGGPASRADSGPAGGAELERAALAAAAPGLHTIPTRYDGPDLAEVAGMLGIPAAEVVRRHVEATWTVAAVGFSPGFGYLTTPDPLFAGVGRRADPRPRVPRGSVALAAQMCAVYPSATPGGWQLVGTTTAELFDVHAEHPALLRVGDHVEFVEVP